MVRDRPDEFAQSSVHLAVWPPRNCRDRRHHHDPDHGERKKDDHKQRSRRYNYGTPMVVGYPNTGATVVALRSAIRAGLSRDSRIDKVLSMIVVAEDDTVDVEATVLPVGGKAAVVVGVSAL